MSENIQLQWSGRSRYKTERASPVSLKPNKEKSLNGDQCDNFIIEGENLSVMASLLGGSFKLRGQVDMLLWDPPYNTGQKDFRYNDDYYLSRKEVEELKRTTEKVIDADEGWVSITDPSRHTKWLNFMAIRLWYGKKLLKKDGIIAVQIDDNELFRLGMLMDEIFLPENRLACAPWLAEPSGGKEKTGLRNGHEYILIYHNGDRSQVTQEEDSHGELNLSDKRGKYRKGRELMKWGGVSLREDRPGQWFPLRAPDGSEVFPVRNDGKEGHWRWGKDRKMKPVLEDPDNAHWEKRPFNEGVVHKGKHERWVPYEKIRDRKKAVGWTTWLDSHGTSADGTREIKEILGSKVFDTPKPVALYEWLVRLHGNEEGLILDCFGGAGTTGHAVLKVNQEDDANRRFIIVENGNGNDRFCSMTADRVRRVITGKWAAGKRDPMPGGFTFLKAGRRITKAQIMESQREDLADIILQADEKTSAKVDCRVEGGRYVIGRARTGEAIALIWDKKGGTDLNKDNFKEILAEVESLNKRTPTLKLKRPVYIYATRNGGPNGSSSYVFCQIPDSILAALVMPEDSE